MPPDLVPPPPPAPGVDASADVSVPPGPDAAVDSPVGPVDGNLVDAPDGGSDSDADDGSTSDADDGSTSDVAVTDAAESDAPDGVADDAGDGGMVSCVNDPRIDTYSPNLPKTGREFMLAFRLIQSVPAPPALNINVLTLKVLKSDGMPFLGNVEATVRMPDSDGRVLIKPVVTLDAATGVYTVRAPFFMPGVWTIQFSAYPSATADASALIDSAVYSFCIQ